MSTQQIIESWESGVEPYNATDCEHEWKETRSYGATVGFDAKCKICGEVATFTPSDEDEFPTS